MNKNIQKIIVLGAVAISATAFSQIKEERLILDKKREPEVRKIEKKKTSVETVKNYPPEEKSQNPVQYDVTNVPAVSDFKTSTIQGEDISPKLGAEYHDNFARFGMGNYGKVLFDGNFSYLLKNKMEVGADGHVISTTGLKKDYPWESRESKVDVGAFMNYYADKGKFNVNTNFQSHDYNYYGIYALNPAWDIELKQQVQNVKIDGYYDYFSNEILNDVRIKTSFLKDYYDARENHAAVDLNLSKHAVKMPWDGVTMNADLGLGIETLQSEFKLLDRNDTNYFEGRIEPKLTFSKGDSYLMIGSGFSFLNSEMYNATMAAQTKTNKTYWFPRAELLFAASEVAKFYVGVDGGLKHNSYEQMLQENPYLVSDQQIIPTETKYRVYFGVKGDVNQNIKYDISAGFAKVNNIMFFRANNIFDPINTLNRSAYNFANTFSAMYDNGSVNHVKASLHYFPIENLVLDGELSYNFYRLNNYERIYNKPQFQGAIGANYSMLDKKLLLGFKGFFASSKISNYFMISPNGTNPAFFDSQEYTDGNVKGFADFNLSAEYKIHKNFSIFALGNNLLNNKYESQKGYKVLGAQIVGGVKVSF